MQSAPKIPLVSEQLVWSRRSIRYPGETDLAPLSPSSAHQTGADRCWAGRATGTFAPSPGSSISRSQHLG